MVQEVINLGSGGNTRTGDPFNEVARKAKSNFAELYDEKAPLESPAFSGAVGIGVSLPLTKLHVEGSGYLGGRGLFRTTDNANSVKIEGVDGATTQETASLELRDNIGATYIGRTGTAAAAGDFRIVHSGAERLRITSSGNVGIGTTAPGAKLEVAGAIRWTGGSDPGTGSALYSVTSGAFQTVLAGATLALHTGNNNARTERIRVDIAGKVGIGRAAPASALDVNGGVAIADGGFLYTPYTGTTETGVVRAGIQLDGLNQCVNFYTSNAYRGQWTANGTFLAASDNTQPFGGPSNRWSVIYAGTGTINTSDAREKTLVRPLSAAEIAAARDLSVEIGIYQWLAMVEQKGEDGARLHIGMTVQRAIEIMEAHGLDPWRYGFICRDEITRKEKVMQIRPVQATEGVEEAYPEIEIRDGVPVQVMKARTVERPVTVMVAVIGEDGQPVTRRVQATEDVVDTVHEIVLQDGQPVQIGREQIVKRPLFNMVAVLDEAGQPVTRIEQVVGESGFPGERAVPVLHPVPVMIDELVMHAVPVMEEREVEVEIDEPAGDRLGFRYDQLTLFMMCGLVARLAELEA